MSRGPMTGIAVPGLDCNLARVSGKLGETLVVEVGVKWDRVESKSTPVLICW